MANGRMNFDQFEEEMNYIPKEFTRGGNKEDKKKIPKMKKDFKEKTKTRVVNDKKKLYEFINE
ncbi:MULTISPECIES: hypothetical protein [Cetobacterium]|jgi:hypothetical protein|uniref:Uncharacterized protein n=1 Tax=Candidatus Cetobacterium colombiensis TaxID=3073100 RepID=A0ABU4WBE3_9FUSO|nr:hypothetical protein [Candidatus Cetobacterium colombiensis]MDX8336841.1 hypothetical protein [Candidatus Cetobacterium colombiensis]